LIFTLVLPFWINTFYLATIALPTNSTFSSYSDHVEPLFLVVDSAGAEGL